MGQSDANFASQSADGLLQDLDAEAADIKRLHNDPAALTATAVRISEKISRLAILVKTAKDEIENRDRAHAQLAVRLVKLENELSGEYQQTSFWSSDIKNMLQRVADLQHDVAWPFAIMHIGCKCRGCSGGSGRVIHLSGFPRSGADV